MSGIGHNSSAYGEDTLIAPVIDDDKKLFHYVQWNLADYISGTRNMTPEQEGIYIRFLTRLYDRGQAFPDDDRRMATEMGLDIRKWRRIRAELLGLGKITIKNESLTNPRFEKERVKRAAELRKQAEATRKYWEKKRAQKATSSGLRPDFEETSPEFRLEVSSNYPEKANKINESKELPNPYTRKSRVQNIKESKSPDGLLSSGSGQSDEPVTASKAARLAFDLYNQTAERCGLPKCRILNDSRKRALALRVKEAGGIEGFRQALANLEQSAFCRGQNAQGWVATIDYVCQPKGFAKLFEGGWGTGKTVKPPSSRRQLADEAWFEREFADSRFNGGQP